MATPCGARRPRWATVLLLADLAIAGLVACGGPAPSAPPLETQPVTHPLADRMTGQRPGSRGCEPWIGVVLPQGFVSVTAPIDGRIAEFLVEAGAEIAERQPIARLENDQLLADLRIAEAARELAQADLAAAGSVAEQAAERYRRRKSNPDAFSNEDIQQALRDRDVSIAKVRAATARVDIETIEFERRSALAGRTEILAPFDGVVFRRFFKAGDAITQGSTVLEVSLRRSDLIRFALPPRARPGIEGVRSLIVTPDEPLRAQPDRARSQPSSAARLTRLLPGLDQIFGALIAEASLEPGTAGLRAGEGVLVRPASCDDPDATEIPIPRQP